MKKETEDGSVPVASTPTAGARVATMPLAIPASIRLATSRCQRPHVLRLVADDDHRVEPAEVAAGAGEEMAAHRLQQRAAAHELASQADPERGLGVRIPGELGEAGLGEVVGEAAGVDRLAHDADRDQPPPCRLERPLDRAVDAPRQVAEGDQADPPSAQPVAHQDREDAIGELVGATELAAQLVGLLRARPGGCR